MAREKRLWQWLSPRLPRGAYTRIETGEVSPGTPDVHYQISPAAKGWMELKATRRPDSLVPFRNEEDGLHASQISWIHQNLNFGAVIWIVAEIGPAVLFIPGGWAEFFNETTRDGLIGAAKFQLSRTLPDQNQLRLLGQLLRNKIG